uniref:phage tail fiber protein n=1 Tax=Rosenbergiella epipactidis TaxID=1544694 RepID=UPI001F4DE893
GLNYDKANWQQILTGSGNVTVNVPDGSQFTGPSWLSLSNSLSGKANSNDVNEALSKKANTSDVKDALSKKANSSDLGSLAGKSILGRNELTTELKRNLFACGATTPNSQGAGVFPFDNTPFGWNTQYGICAQFSNLTSSDPGAGQGKWQHYLAMGTNGDIIYVTNINESYTARKLYSTTNTSTNSNGALVPASPIIRVVNGKNCTRQDLLGAENKEYAWQSDYGLSNAEAEGCSVTKLDTGKYLITGATSLAKDLWQVMDCGNGQGRIIALAEVVETEKGIEVHCYKQKYTLSDDGDLTVGRGDLIDIPDNTWIDVRLEMPDDSIWNKKQIQPTQENSTAS